MSKQKFSFIEAIERIKKLVSFADTAAAGDTSVAGDLKEYTTNGAVKLKIDKLEVGGKVYLEDGVTLVDKDVTLSDGTVLAIGTDGVITAITVPVKEEAVPDKAEVEAIAAKFAEGTPEERIANLETMSQAMMRYCFGWKIEEQTRKAIEEQAIAVFETIAPPTQLTAQFTAQIDAVKKVGQAESQRFSKAMGEILDLFQQFADTANGDPAQKPATGIQAPTKAEKAAAVIAAARESARNK